MPQLHDAGAQLHFVGGQLARAERVFGCVGGGGQGLDVVARCQQLGNHALGVQNAFALHFGRVGGEHRRDKAVRQRLRNHLGRNAGPAQAGQRHFDAAFLRVTGALVHHAAADVVPVFGQVGQMAEIREGADDADGLVTRQTFEQFFQGLVGLGVGIAPETHREFAHLLDQLIGRLAFLFADHVAQNAAQQANVFDQRAFVVACAGSAGAGGGAGWGRGFAPC